MRLHLRCGIMRVGQRREHNSLMFCIAESATRLDNAQTTHAVRYCSLKCVRVIWEISHEQRLCLVAINPKIMLRTKQFNN